MNYKEAMKTFDRMFTGFPDGKRTIEDIVVEGEKVVARWSFSGTHKGPYMGVPPTAKKVQWEFIGIYKVSGDKIVEGWVIADNLGLMQQLGIPFPKK